MDQETIQLIAILLGAFIGAPVGLGLAVAIVIRAIHRAERDDATAPARPAFPPNEETSRR